MSELGKLEKPSTDSFKGKRKLYCVPNIIPFNDPPDEYIALSNKYWSDIYIQLEKLSSVFGIQKIFCENIYINNENEALNVLEKTNIKVFELVKENIKKGASLIPLENRELLGAFIDWRNCLGVVRTPDIFKKVYDFYTETLNNRLEHVQNTILDNLQEGEACLLIMEDEMRAKIQFPPDIDVFLIRPPSYDDILKWFRDNLR